MSCLNTPLLSWAMSLQKQTLLFQLARWKLARALVQARVRQQYAVLPRPRRKRRTPLNPHLIGHRPGFYSWAAFSLSLAPGLETLPCSAVTQKLIHDFATQRHLEQLWCLSSILRHCYPKHTFRILDFVDRDNPGFRTRNGWSSRRTYFRSRLFPHARLLRQLPCRFRHDDVESLHSLLASSPGPSNLCGYRYGIAFRA